MTISISVHGASGKLGSMILKHGGCSITTKGGTPPPCDVVIDVTSSQGTADLLTRMTNQALLVGTTGDLPWRALREYATRAPVAVVPNFSIGVPLLIELVETAVQALPTGWDIEIIEAHHNQKKDAPSGTAKRLIKAIQNQGITDVPTHALRVGDTFGEHTVWMCGPGERIELKHVATGRQVFAIGAVRWARWLSEQPIGLYTP